MARMHLTVDIEIGPRTDTSVVVSSRAVNTKVSHLKNGIRVTDDQIAEWIASNLLEALKELEQRIS